ncbi:MAG TPA: hypothetical protein PLV64_23830 [Anaerolineales bacterium]|nr:hypothetical protein [Anaerolineales bacterium]
MRDRLSTIGLLFILILLIVVFLGLAGVGDNKSPLGLEPRARQAVAAQGFTNIEYQGFEFWACGSDSQGWNYTATNPAGVVVHLTACTENGFFGINKSFWIITR